MSSRARPTTTMTRRLRSGHTLWEVLLVLALLGTIGAVVAPAVTATRAAAPADEATRATNDLVALLGDTRRAALERGVALQLTIEPATGRYWLFALRDGELRLVAESTLTPGVRAALEADAPRVHFRFDPSGAAAGGTITVRGDDAARRVGVVPWTGAPRVDSR